MIDLRRLRGVLFISAFLSLCLAVCELALGASRPWWPMRLKNDWATWQLECYKRVGLQISELLRDGLPSDRRLGLLLGSSSQVGINPKALEQRLSPQLCWLRLNGYGASMCELEEVLRLVLRNDIRPAIVVVAMELGALAHASDYIDTVLSDVGDFPLPPALDAAQLRPSFLFPEAVEPMVSNVFNRCFPRRVLIMNRLWCGLTEFRLALLEAMGQTAFAAFPPTPRQNRVIEGVRPLQGETAPAEMVSVMLRTYRDKGQFRPEAYGAGTDASRSLASIVKMARSVKADVVIVVLPVNTFMRDKVPPVARQTLFDLLRQSFGATAPPVIDLSDVLADDQFYDLVHANGKGAPKLTDKVIEELTKSLRPGTAR